VAVVRVEVEGKAEGAAACASRNGAIDVPSLQQ